MKKTIIFISARVFAVVALCSCGGKSSSSGSAHSQKVNTAADGKWQCTDIPESMKLEKITLEIKDGNFTYTTADSKTTAIAEGYVKETGTKNAVLFIEKQKQIQNSDNKVISEISVEKSVSESQTVDVTYTDDNHMTLKAVTLELNLERTDTTIK